MRRGKGAPRTEATPNCASLTRREALTLFGGAAISVALAGCGGGDNSSNPGPSASINRTAISGDLTKQVNQFSTVAQTPTDTWLGTSTALDALKNVPTRSAITRAPADSKIVVQALVIGTNGTRSAYERLCNLALMLDDMGNSAQLVMANNSSLTGSNAVNNEQWLMAMIAQNYAAVSVTGTLFIMQMVAGLPEAISWALARTTDSEKLAAYGLVADVFNTWVDALTAAGNITPNPAWKLDVSSAVSAANIQTKLNAINTILPQLPFSPGYRKAGASLMSLDDASLGATGIRNFAQTFTGALAQRTLSTTPLTDTFPQTVDTTKAHYDVTARLGTTGVGQTIAGLPGGLAAAQTAINTLLSSTDGASWPGVTGDSAQCQVQIIAQIYGFLQAMQTALITTQSALGSLITGAQAIANLANLDTTILTCGSPLQQSLWAAVKSDRDLLKSQQLYNGAVPTTRQVSVVVVTGLREIDQIGAAGVSCTNEITVSAPDVCPLDPKNPVISDYRNIVAGLTKLPNCPRTFRNVLICITGLQYDVALHYTQTVAASWEGSKLKFCAQSFGRMLRREPGATFAEIPAITQAQLLCTGVGFIPSKSLTPQDLSIIPAMPTLFSITNLVGGVPIHVH